VSDDLLGNYTSALLWNQPSSAVYWFHYTSRLAARAIGQDRIFEVSASQAVGRAGIYVCSYQPGSLTEDELARRLLDGSFHQRERLQAVVVLTADSDLAFTSDPDTPDGMRFLADPGSVVLLGRQLVGFAERVGNQWRHSRRCFDPAVLRTLAARGSHHLQKGWSDTL
jgi:hypothetical protein